MNDKILTENLAESAKASGRSAGLGRLGGNGCCGGGMCRNERRKNSRQQHASEQSKNQIMGEIK